jgi:DNA-directed RNA polymerase specialized sigma24 family protein
LIFDDALMESLAGSFATVRGEQAARLDRLEDCLAKLLPPARDICDLRYREVLSLEAIATLD